MNVLNSGVEYSLSYTAAHKHSIPQGVVACSSDQNVAPVRCKAHRNANAGAYFLGNWSCFPTTQLIWTKKLRCSNMATGAKKQRNLSKGDEKQTGEKQIKKQLHVCMTFKAWVGNVWKSS